MTTAGEGIPKRNINDHILELIILDLSSEVSILGVREIRVARGGYRKLSVIGVVYARSTRLV